MNRYWTALACALLLGIGAFALHAEVSSTLVIDPSDMKDGEKKTITDDGRKITVERDGNTTNVAIEGADKTEKLTITRDGNQIRIGRIDADGATSRSFVFGPDRRKIVIDGVPLMDFDGYRTHVLRPRTNKVHTYFVCPKDETTLRVPDGKEDATYKCPIDGTTMEKKKGRGFTFFFDEDLLESNVL